MRLLTSQQIAVLGVREGDCQGVWIGVAAECGEQQHGPVHIGQRTGEVASEHRRARTSGGQALVAHCLGTHDGGMPRDRGALRSTATDQPG